MANKDAQRPTKELALPDSDMTLVMTYAVFNDILRFVGSIEEAVSSLMTNQEIRDLIIRRMLTDTKKPIDELTDLMPSNEVELDIFEIEDVLGWVMEHLVYFFMKSATRMQESAAKYPELLKKMTTSSNPSEAGLTASETPTKSAGPTE